jgi:hypothetical protein
MTRKRNLIIVGLILTGMVLIDVLLRLFYFYNLHLRFDSQKFNNITTPIISLLGFLAVVITILLTLKQLKHQQGSNYLNYYKDQINTLAAQTPASKQGIGFSTMELLNYPMFVSEKYDLLKKFPEYVLDLDKYKAGISVNSDGKDYDKILGHIRYFSASLGILLRQYKSLINEIDSHKILDTSQKQLLLKELMDSQVEKYYTGCWLIDTYDEFPEIKKNLYWAFAVHMKADTKFFDSRFYELKNLIDKRPDLKQHTVS